MPQTATGDDADSNRPPDQRDAADLKLYAGKHISYENPTADGYTADQILRALLPEIRVHADQSLQYAELNGRLTQVSTDLKEARDGIVEKQQELEERDQAHGNEVAKLHQQYDTKVSVLRGHALSSLPLPLLRIPHRRISTVILRMEKFSHREVLHVYDVDKDGDRYKICAQQLRN